jgi:glutaconate CoA-transferase subunit B
MEPDGTGELIITALHPGIQVQQMKDNTGWDLKAANEIRVTEPPNVDELRILREELDPQGIYR